MGKPGAYSVAGQPQSLSGREAIIEKWPDLESGGCRGRTCRPDQFNFSH